MIFSHEFRVRYAETDQMRVTYYANYLVWFEMGRAEYLRHLGINYQDCEEKGYFLPAVEAHCRYLASSGYDDLLKIEVVVDQMKNSSLRFSYRIFNQSTGKNCCEGYTVHAFINSAKRPVRIPEEIRLAIPLQEFPAAVKS